MSRSPSISATLFTLAVCMAWHAGAETLTAQGAVEAGCVGRQTCAVGAFRLSAGPAPAVLIDQGFRGLLGVGVALTDTAADRDREIQGALEAFGLEGETLVLVLDAPRAVARIEIGHLFNPAMPGDPPEGAVIEGFLAGRSVGAVRVVNLSESEGGYRAEGRNPEGTVQRLSSATGHFAIERPFGSPVDRIAFTAPGVEDGDTSDYSLVSVTLGP